MGTPPPSPQYPYNRTDPPTLFFRHATTVTTVTTRTYNPTRPQTRPKWPCQASLTVITGPMSSATVRSPQSASERHPAQPHHARPYARHNRHSLRRITVTSGTFRPLEESRRIRWARVDTLCGETNLPPRTTNQGDCHELHHEYPASQRTGIVL